MDSPAILPLTGAKYVDHASVIVVGGGACGLSAALSGREAGAGVLVLERESEPLGTTAMSIGFIPAAGTRSQREAGIDDHPDVMADDILAKNKGETDRAMVHHLARESAATIDWLIDNHRVPLTFLEKDHYPGHSRPRMHGTPNRSGKEMMQALLTAAKRSGVKVETNATVTSLFADMTQRVHGVRFVNGEGEQVDISCDALILACCGYAASRAMISTYIPEILDAVFFGHVGSQGDAVRWGQALGAETADLHAYQSHGGLVWEKKFPVPWAHILRGGVQVNADGRRFSDESKNYADRALDVLAQPGHFAWSLFDQRIEDILLNYKPYRDALDAGCVITADTMEKLQTLTGLPISVAETLEEIAECAAGRRSDPLGRDFTGEPPLAPSYKAVKVTGALYHTQGGLVVDQRGRVMRNGGAGNDGAPLPNLFAGGGAARGISGPGSWGYLAGNGLLTATVLGRLAGQAAAEEALRHAGGE